MKYLVPYDFTNITASAMQHAIGLSQVTGAEVELLHLVPDEKSIGPAEAKFQEVIEQLSDSEKSIVSATVKVGDIFKDISSEAEAQEAQLLIMGTHGAKGLQKLFGSHAMKVVTSSATPFIITQEKGPGQKIERIVMPVDLTKESIKVVGFAADLAKKFKAEVHLVFAEEKDEWLSKKLQVNTATARIELQKHGVPFEVHELAGKKALHKEVIDYGAKHRADLFAIAHFSESILPQFDAFSQEMITNKLEVPVLIVSAEAVGKAKSNYSFITI